MLVQQSLKKSPSCRLEKSRSYYEVTKLFFYKCTIEPRMQHIDSLKSYACNQCPKVFHMKKHLHRHMRAHNGERYHQCDKCPKLFHRKEHLTRHKRTHSGDFSYRCDECARLFHRKEHLTRHKRIHSGGRHHQCDECDFRTNRADGLKRHIEMHNKQKGYALSCNFISYGTKTWIEGSGELKCYIRCKGKRQMDTHIQRSHTLEGLNKRLKTENQMADLFDKHNIPYDRDYQNLISHSACPSLKNMFTGKYSRPDFHLYTMQATHNIICLVGNDEFSHRVYCCDFDRILKITTALSSTSEFFNVKVLYIRFNPHFFYQNGVIHDPNLDSRHFTLLNVIKQVCNGDIRINENGLSLIYLFYDRDSDGELLIFKNATPENKEFAVSIRPCVLDILI